ncbi:hypothetical protein [Acidovorax sp. BLS4]|uniref:hypothetical protein n=1 Tax=Acidovorax sp. BLS4 TaxID=3273430 RepID=UPI0029421A7B|nr:hypothetical protein [Paracidovorax avenae]WOI43770.1 hypothetical protein R1Z03_14615 [Paracidovorax avenae]
MSATESAVKELVAQRLEVIRRCMPNTLACIEDRVAAIGTKAYALVRQGLRGEPGCFYAIEAGHVVGCPAGMDVQTLEEAGRFMVIFGSAHVCIWPAWVWSAAPAEAGSGNGAH